MEQLAAWRRMAKNEDVYKRQGMERETERRRRDFNGFCLDAARMALAKPDCICLLYTSRCV